METELERYRAKINFQHKFEDVKQKFDGNIFPVIRSPTFFARNIKFNLDLKTENGDISCFLACDRVKRPHYSLKVEYQLSLITTSKTVQSAEFCSTFNQDDFYDGIILSQIFPGEEILVDDAVTLEVELLVDEPQGIIRYIPPKRKVRRKLQIKENKIQGDAFASLLESGDFSDMTFVVNEDSSKVKAHKNILEARSKVFARMLTTDMKEAKDNEIRIDDMGAPALKIMLHHIYSGQLEFPKGVKTDLKICQELVNAAEKYDLQNFKEYAAMAMTEFVSLENAWELFAFAKRLKAQDATKELRLYYVENVHKIMDKL